MFYFNRKLRAKASVASDRGAQENILTDENAQMRKTKILENPMQMMRFSPVFVFPVLALASVTSKAGCRAKEFSAAAVFQGALIT